MEGGGGGGVPCGGHRSEDRGALGPRGPEALRLGGPRGSWLEDRPLSTAQLQ